ncbi:MAG TPA: DUF5667 domain-containing protein [Actinomycetota bacterium]|nr:DUF5667 domain-containing protein [Actinomycetota bacterium]
MGTRRVRDDLDRLLDRLDAAEGAATGDLAPLLHPARAARPALIHSVPSNVAADHLAALRSDRARNVVVAPPLRRRGMRLVAASLAAGMILVLGAGSAVAASSSALPGDTLYGVKRAVERVSLAMHRDPGSRAELQLQFAATRLAEIDALLAAGEDPAEALDGLEDALAGAEDDALHAIALGQDAGALLAHVNEMISKHIAVLTGVMGKVPDQAKDAIQRAIDNAEKAKANVQKGKDNKPDDAGPPDELPNDGAPVGPGTKGKS